MTKLYSVKGKPKMIDNVNDIDYLVIHSTAFIIEVDIISINEKHWSRFKQNKRYVIDDITYYDLIVYHIAKLKIIRGIYWDEGIFDNDFIISDLLVRKFNLDDVNEIKNIKNDINYIHGLLLMKDKLKKYIKSKNELDSFLECNEPILFGYYKKKLDNNYNVYLPKIIDLNYTNVLYGVQIRSMAKSIMNRYFRYCDDNNIKMFYCNTDSIIIRENDLNKM
jgi:hypothetical protein